MKRILHFNLVLLSINLFSASVLQAQMDQLRGTDDEFRMGIHAGNRFRTTFFNDGTYGGRVGTPGEIAGEWPIGSGHYYFIDGNIFVGSEVIDNQGVLRHINSENKSVNVGGSRGDQDPVSGEWWTFLPLYGFANPNNDKIAMAKSFADKEDSWPAYWPDKYDDPTDPGWRNDNVDNNPLKAAWNGYFGKQKFSADEESYFVADDYMNREFDFYPDSTDLERRGLGFRIYVRGFQWTKTAVNDALFCLYDIENIGTYLHDKIIFGYKIGNNMGETVNGSDSEDDCAAFDRDLDLAYMWDDGDQGAGGWGPVGYFGGAFLESPGNPYDGIDNDNDSRDPVPGVPGTGTGPELTESVWEPKTLNLTDPIVLINYDTFARRLTTLAEELDRVGGDTLEVFYNTRIFKFWDGKLLEEIGDNLVDDNLNGLIDENRGGESFETGVFTYLYIVGGEGYKYIDYFSSDSSSNGMSNPLLDERRDDGVDNDGDWDIGADDTGVDGLLPGVPGYPGVDFGEGDGLPTNGEPHFDKTDIDESDMLGLTSFTLYDWRSLNQYDDEDYWRAMVPGTFSAPMIHLNVELLYASGYFPLVPGQTERISMAILCGEDYDDLIRNKQYVAEAYGQNYQFAQAPYIPTVRALAGDNRVTLFWDDFAESTYDPITGEDFEGYKIYRSTDTGWNDPDRITDPFGSHAGEEPMAQFDLDNEYSEFSPVPKEVGIQFWLGENTGLRHFWVDTTAKNGFTYYYAVTSYDRGDLDRGISPEECTKYVALQQTGEVEKGSNVVVVRPEARAVGFTPPELKDSQVISGPQNTADGTVNYNIIEYDSVRDNHTYQITFKDTLSPNSMDSTQYFTLVNMTTNKTLLEDHPLEGDLGGLPIVEGFQLVFENNPGELDIDTLGTGWNNAGIPDYLFEPYSYRDQPVETMIGDFEIIFADVGVDTSKYYYRGSEDMDPKPVNFTVINTLTNEKVPFAFRERHEEPGEEGVFSFDLRRRRSDEIVFLADPDPDSLVASWWMRVFILSATQADSMIPGPGDVLTIKLNKPFLSHDTFEFTTIAQSIDQNLTEDDLDNIKVVPNPYIVSNSWEPRNPYADGRGEREIHFTHLPPKCTIKIFNVRGQLVNTLEYDDASDNTDGTYSGTYIWDMLSKDNLEISYGIYIYHVEAEGIGEKIGKFAVIK